MPIGLDDGGFGGGSRPDRRISSDELGGVIRPAPGQITPEELGEIVDSAPGRVSPEELGAFLRAADPPVPILWTRWRTAADERVCPECGPLDGAAWPAGEGPMPPLHNHCRCVRAFAFVEWATRVP